MTHPFSSLLMRILFWFFLTVTVVSTALIAFFVFQAQMSFYSVFGGHVAKRLRTAGMTISSDLNQHPGTEWNKILSKHAKINQMDFLLVDDYGKTFFSADVQIPGGVLEKVRELLGPHPPWEGAFPPGEAPPGGAGPPGGNDPSHPPPLMGQTPPPFGTDVKSDHFLMRTKTPTRYWFGIRVLLKSRQGRPHRSAVLLAVSDSATGNGFFFDSLPWMMAVGLVILISLFIWIPIVRHITTPISNMMQATKSIAKGDFDVSIPESGPDEIRRLAGAINHMAFRLSALLKGQKRFLGDIAHELGSPISRIHFGLAVLEELIQGDNKKRVADILEDVEQMSGLVDELLVFSRAEMDADSVKLKQQVLLPVVQEAVRRETTASNKFIINIDPELQVVGSAELLTRAIANLIRNAFEHAGENYPVFISAEKIKDEIEIKVRDYGPGVPEDAIPQLFEPFFRTDPSRGRDSGGVGLGLAIVKTCVETCRGSVSAQNHEDKGFVVSIRLNTMLGG